MAVSIPFLIAGIIILRRDRGIEQRFATESRITSGKVLIKSRSTDSPHSYYVSYLYRVPSGQKRYGAARLPLEPWEALTELGPIPVSYLATDDERSRVPHAIENINLGPAFAIAGGLLTLIAGYLLFRK